MGYCSASNTCLGRKIDGDYCEINGECESGLCKVNKCTTK